MFIHSYMVVKKYSENVVQNVIKKKPKNVGTCRLYNLRKN